jgi:hypothetical protein
LRKKEDLIKSNKRIYKNKKIIKKKIKKIEIKCYNQVKRKPEELLWQDQVNNYLIII